MKTTRLLLAEPPPLTEAEVEFFDRLTDGLQPVAAQPVTYDPIRLGLAIGNFIAALGEPRIPGMDAMNGLKRTR